MTTLFETGTLERTNQTEAFLLWELGCRYSLVSCLDAEKKALSFVRAWEYKETLLEESIDQIVHLLHAAGYATEKLVLASAFPEMLLLPKAFESGDKDLLSEFFPFKMHLFRDEVKGADMETVYGIPARTWQQLQKAYPEAQFIHAATPALLGENGASVGNSILVFFVGKMFRVVVYKEGALQLVQLYSYTAPLDVVYYLLQLCAFFSLSQEEVQLHLSGFVNSDGLLYRELLQYFRNIRFATPDSLNLVDNSHPPHYFASLYNMASCVL